MFGTAVQDYVKAIYQLGDEGERVTPTAVSEALRVTPAAVTKMVRRLTDLELATYARGEGIRLTSGGEKVALEMLRHHRLLETYLAEHLGYSWDRVHDEAEKLEHVISEEFEEKIDSALGRPTHDPHGSPIPTRDGRIVAQNHPALATVPAPATVRLERVSDRDPAMLRYLDDLGLRLGSEFRVTGREPYGDALRIEIAAEPRTLSAEVAESVFVSVQGEKQ